MFCKKNCLLALVIAASPAGARRDDAVLRLPVIEASQTLGPIDRFGDRPVAFCAATPIQSQSWPLQVQGAEQFPGRNCLVGRVTKTGGQGSDRVWTHGFAFAVDPVLQRLLDSTSCLSPKTLKGAKIVSVLRSREARGHGAGYRFEGDTEEADVVTIGVGSAGPPLIAVLAASRPTIWDLSAIPPGRLRAVLLVGSKGQATADAPRNTMVRFLTPDASDVACGSPLSLSRVGAQAGLTELVRTALKGEPEAIDGRDPVAISLDDGPPPRPRSTIISPEAVQSAQPLDQDEMPPGIAGLTKLFQEGAIRRARQADVDSWLAARERAHLPTVVLGADDVFVVTRAITVPTGLYGSASVRFIVPAGVAIPIDPGSHNAYYMIADGQCRGAQSCS